MKVERIIKGNLVEYKVELSLIDYSYYRLEFEVYTREKGKRKWRFLPFTYREERELKELLYQYKRKERNELFISLVKKHIPNITEILQELQKELAEEIKNKVLELNLI